MSQPAAESESRRVVVTGLGAVTPLGVDVETSWRRLIAGESGGAAITAFHTNGHPVRIACEAITNAALHSGASTVTLRLERDGSLTRLRIADSGRGFDIAAPSSGFGLIAMRERAHSVGGELRIRSIPGRGSEVEAKV